MPNVRSRDKAPIIIYIERTLLDAMRRQANALGMTLVDLQADYLDRHCQLILGKHQEWNPTRKSR